jgi:hypothetical protein
MGPRQCAYSTERAHVCWAKHFILNRIRLRSMETGEKQTSRPTLGR